MNELQKFRQAAKERGLCEKYEKMWQDTTSNKRLVDIALDSNGIPYICQAIADGWGLTPEYIKTRFRMFINNNYLSRQKGYTSRLFVKHSDNILVFSTNTVLISCAANVIVPNGIVCNIYAVNSKVNIIGRGTCYVWKYGETVVSAEREIKIVEKS